MRYISRNLYLILIFLIVFSPIQPNISFALDPKFELDLNILGNKQIRQGNSTLSPLKTKVPPRSSNDTDPRAQKAKITPLENVSKKSRLTKDVRRSKKSLQTKGRSGRRQAKYSSKPRHVIAKYRMTRPKLSAAAKTGTQPDNYHSLHILSPVSGTEDEIVLARNIWNKLVDGDGPEINSLQVNGRNFSISLDPARYPIFPASDGGKIVVDAKGTLPQLVKAIIQEKEPNLRIVEAKPDNRNLFYASLLAAARFYSVEENFSVNFGSDPKLTVTSDFKIEKNTESLLHNDILLLNIDEKRMGLPFPLLDFLAKDGFQVVDLYPVQGEPEKERRNTLYSIRTLNQQSIVDSLLKILPIRYETDRNIQLDDGSFSGVNLSIRAERFMERDGKGIVVSFNDADPVNYTLLKLLEIKGYKVVTINPDDEFRQIIEKILFILKLPTNYGMHSLVQQQGAPFNVHLSGFVIPGSGGEGSSTFLTNVEVNPLIRVLADATGYSFIEN